MAPAVRKLRRALSFKMIGLQWPRSWDILGIVVIDPQTQKDNLEKIKDATRYKQRTVFAAPRAQVTCIPSEDLGRRPGCPNPHLAESLIPYVYPCTLQNMPPTHTSPNLISFSFWNSLYCFLCMNFTNITYINTNNEAEILREAAIVYAVSQSQWQYQSSAPAAQVYSMAKEQKLLNLQGAEET